MTEDQKQNFERLVGVIKKLLDPGGCDWDREQTHESLVPYLLEETYEVIESIETGDMEALKEELGDLMLHVIFQAELAEREGHFTLSESLKGVSDKLVERHPHVFSDAKNPKDEGMTWEQVKKKTKNRESVLDGVPKHLPSLTKARRIQEKASSVGFDWKEIEPVWAKVDEEIDELKSATDENDIEHIKEELGDVLFSLVNLARFLDIDPDASLRSTILKFENRFKKVEKVLSEKGKTVQESDLDEMDQIWNDIKKNK